jgi:hypothetical protein
MWFLSKYQNKVYNVEKGAARFAFHNIFLVRLSNKSGAYEYEVMTLEWNLTIQFSYYLTLLTGAVRKKYWFFFSVARGN